MALDDFNRANENPLTATNWSSVGISNLQVVSNQCATAAAANGIGSMAWLTPMAADCYVEIVVATRQETGKEIYLCLRGSNNSSEATRTGYRMRWIRGGDCTISKENGDNTLTTLATAVGPAYADGDTIRFTATGTTLEVTRNGSSVVSTTDSTYTSGGFVAFGSSRTGTNIGRYDNFDASPPQGAKAGYGAVGATASGESASTFVESGFATVGTVGSGNKDFTGTTTYTKAGYATVGAVGSGPKDHTSPAVVHTKAGFGKVGATVAAATSGFFADVVPEGVSIAFGSTTLDPYPTWTRIDQ